MEKTNRGRASDEVRAILDDAAEGRTRWTAAELRRLPNEPVQWLIEGLLAPGVTLFGAMQKEGKSVFAFQAACAIAKGEKFLGRETRRTKVLYISIDEQSTSVLKRQSFPFTEGDDEDSFNLIVGWPRFDQGGLKTLTEYLVNNHEYGLVIIDTLQKWWPTSVKRGYDHDTEVMDALTRTLAGLKRPVAVLLVHHTKKKVRDGNWEESFYGSNGIPAGARNLWHIAKTSPVVPDEGPYVFHAKGRTIRGEAFRLMRKLHYFEELSVAGEQEESHNFEWVLDDRSAGDKTSEGMLAGL